MIATSLLPGSTLPATHWFWLGIGALGLVLGAGIPLFCLFFPKSWRYLRRTVGRCRLWAKCCSVSPSEQPYCGSAAGMCFEQRIPGKIEAYTINQPAQHCRIHVWLDTIARLDSANLLTQAERPESRGDSTDPPQLRRKAFGSTVLDRSAFVIADRTNDLRLTCFPRGARSQMDFQRKSFDTRNVELKVTVLLAYHLSITSTPLQFRDIVDTLRFDFEGMLTNTVRGWLGAEIRERSYEEALSHVPEIVALLNQQWRDVCQQGSSQLAVLHAKGVDVVFTGLTIDPLYPREQVRMQKYHHRLLATMRKETLNWQKQIQANRINHMANIEKIIAQINESIHRLHTISTESMENQATAIVESIKRVTAPDDVVNLVTMQDLNPGQMLDDLTHLKEAMAKLQELRVR